ncbi:hypothetical protein ACU4GD_11245 [Cupriavidus basilensis]
MTDESMPIPLGIQADTGRPLAEIDAQAVAAFTAHEHAERRAPERAAEKARQAGTYAVLGDVDGDKLDEAGWGLLFPSDADPAPYLDALAPLIAWRHREAGQVTIFQGADGCLPGESAATWLARHKVSLNVVDPALGVPYYLVLVGPPDKISFAFQYTLDLYWAVGRLDFPQLADFRSYADSVTAYETMASVTARRRIALFATCHDFRSRHPAAHAATGHPAQPWHRRKPKPLASARRFAMQALLGEAATKSALAEVLRGKGPGRPARPASSPAPHGMGFRADDARLAESPGRHRLPGLAWLWRDRPRALVRRARCARRRAVPRPHPVLLCLLWRRLPRIRQLRSRPRRPRAARAGPLHRPPAAAAACAPPRRRAGGARACRQGLVGLRLPVRARGPADPGIPRRDRQACCAASASRASHGSLQHPLGRAQHGTGGGCCCDRGAGAAVSDTEIALRWVAQDDAPQLRGAGRSGGTAEVRDIALTIAGWGLAHWPDRSPGAPCTVAPGHTQAARISVAQPNDATSTRIP